MIYYLRDYRMDHKEKNMFIFGPSSFFDLNRHVFTNEKKTMAKLIRSIQTVTVFEAYSFFSTLFHYKITDFVSNAIEALIHLVRYLLLMNGFLDPNHQNMASISKQIT